MFNTKFATDLESLYVSYGFYHAHIANKLIHVLCIPFLTATTIGFGLFGPQFSIGSPYLIVHLGLILYFVSSWIYLKVDFLSGVISTAVYGVLNILLNYIAVNYSSSLGSIVLWTQVIAWALQFIGHGVFEGRRPALTENILLIFAAPDFVILEIMFALGYKKEFQDKCDKLIIQRAAREASEKSD